jgi:hypothetical protein
MKIITSIYLNCRPELRNDWLVGVEADLDAEDAMVGKPQEVALRALVAFYNKTNYAAHLAPTTLEDSGHRRSESTSAVVIDEPVPPGFRRRSRLSSVSSDADLFPLRDSMPYNPDGMIEYWMHEYEDVMRQVFGDGTRPDEDWDEEEGDDDDMDLVRANPGAPGPAERDDPAWIRLTELMRTRGAPEEDTISDSESVVSVGQLGDDARLDAEREGRTMFEAMQERQRRRSNGDENTWEVSLRSNTLILILTRHSTCRRQHSSSSRNHRPTGAAHRPLGARRCAPSWASLPPWARALTTSCSRTTRTSPAPCPSTPRRATRWSASLTRSMRSSGLISFEYAFVAAVWWVEAVGQWRHDPAKATDQLTLVLAYAPVRSRTGSIRPRHLPSTMSHRTRYAIRSI